jgi:hypothetical protein
VTWILWRVQESSIFPLFSDKSSSQLSNFPQTSANSIYRMLISYPPPSSRPTAALPFTTALSTTARCGSGIRSHLHPGPALIGSTDPKNHLAIKDNHPKRCFFTMVSDERVRRQDIARFFYKETIRVWKQQIKKISKIHPRGVASLNLSCCSLWGEKQSELGLGGMSSPEQASLAFLHKPHLFLVLTAN